MQFQLMVCNLLRSTTRVASKLQTDSKGMTVSKVNCEMSNDFYM